MVQKSRSKEVWLVPKRGSLHQTICLIESIINRNYDNVTWNEQKQNNIGNDLRKRGAVKIKRSPSNQSVRTLLASIPQYFGFLYIDNTTPNTIKLTEAGKKLFFEHKNNIKNIGNLSEGEKNGELIQSSTIFLEQFEKLQITNPVILKDCENIYIFPFRVVVKILFEVGYIDREELAYFIFSIKNEDEIPLVIEKIKKFRKQEKIDRDREIDLFKNTHIGQITLVKAPSATYFENLCENTGLLKRVKVQKPNPGSSKSEKIQSIEIINGNEEYLTDILDNKYRYAQIYDFKKNLKLWIDYIGNPKRLMPPIDIELSLYNNNSAIIVIQQKGILLDGDLISKKHSLSYPMFVDEEYEVLVINPDNGAISSNNKIIPKIGDKKFVFNSVGGGSFKKTIKQIGEEIIEHSNCKNFAGNFLNYLGILEGINGLKYIENKNLRGAYYEYLFYMLLDELKKIDVIDDVYWNGSIGCFGLPIPAPGGKNGISDLVFKINNEFFVLELTTIKPKSTQFSAEGSSVPDHIRIFAENNDTSKTHGVFSAPIIHSRNTATMQAALKPFNIFIKCIEDRDLVNLLSTKQRSLIYNKLISL